MADEMTLLYRRLVKLVHTDTSPRDEFAARTRTMQLINDAYRRRDYAFLKQLEASMPPGSRSSSDAEAQSDRETKDLVEEGWGRFLLAVHVRNRRVETALHHFSIYRVRDHSLILHCPYEFYRNLVMADDRKMTIEDALYETYGMTLDLEVVD